MFINDFLFYKSSFSTGLCVVSLIIVKSNSSLLKFPPISRSNTTEERASDTITPMDNFKNKFNLKQHSEAAKEKTIAMVAKSPAKKVKNRTKKKVATSGKKKDTMSTGIKRKEPEKLKNKSKKKKTTKKTVSLLDKMFKLANTKKNPTNEDGPLLSVTELLQVINKENEFQFPEPRKLDEKTDMYYTYSPTALYSIGKTGFETYTFLPGRQYSFNGMTLSSNSLTIILNPKSKHELAFIKNMDTLQRTIAVDFLKRKCKAPSRDAKTVIKGLDNVRHCIQETGKGMEPSDMKPLSSQLFKINKDYQYCIRMTVHRDVDIVYDKPSYQSDEHKGRQDCVVLPNDRVHFSAKFQGFRVKTPDDDTDVNTHFIFPLMTITKVKITGEGECPDKFKPPLPPHPDDIKDIEEENFGLGEITGEED